MKKNKRNNIIAIVIILTLFTSLSTGISSNGLAQSSEAIDCKYGISPTIDGFISPGEWNDANFIQYTLDENAVATIYFKEDGENLYVAFDIPTPEHDNDDSGILLDTDHNAGSRPQRDDIAIQQRRDGSEKRELIGTGFNWVYIPATGWTEETSSSDSGWQIEYSIEYSKLGITPDEAKTLGIGFHILDNGKEYDWPINPCFNVPDNWADIYSSDNWGISENIPPTASAIANPTSGSAPLTVSFTGSGTDSDGEISEYYWDFDDGTTSNEQNPTHTFQLVDTYNVLFTVTDDGGAIGIDEVMISVSDESNNGVEPEPPEDNDTAPKEKGEEESETFLPAFEAFYIISGIIIVILFVKKRRGAKYV